MWIKYNTWWHAIKISIVLQRKCTIESALIFHTVASWHFSFAPAISRERKLKYRHDDAWIHRRATRYILVAARRNIKNTFPGLLRNNQFHGLALPLVAFFIAAFSVCRSKKKKGKKRERERKFCPGLVWNRAFSVSFTSKTAAAGGKINTRGSTILKRDVLFFYPRVHRAARFARVVCDARRNVLRWIATNVDVVHVIAVGYTKKKLVVSTSRRTRRLLLL